MFRGVHIIVRGGVQGVGFRIYTQREAERLGLRGYVRNRSDGAVEIVAEGRDDTIVRLIEWAKHGPPSAVVEDVSVEDTELTGEFGDFSIRN